MRLHGAIQVAMGWSDYHMHVFSTDACDYGVPDPELGFLDQRRDDALASASEAGRPDPLHV